MPERSHDLRRPPDTIGSDRRRGLASDRGQALVETALVLPLLLLVAVGIFEFGRAYQTYQVLTNAAREGARLAVLPDSTTDDVQSRVVAYMQGGALDNYGNATIAVNQNATLSAGATTASASVVTVTYPFSFMVLNPIARLVVTGSALGDTPLTLSASAEMRNEAQ
jgi:Flp pilus assembly protein TadG